MLNHVSSAPFPLGFTGVLLCNPLVHNGHHNLVVRQNGLRLEIVLGGILFGVSFYVSSRHTHPNIFSTKNAKEVDKVLLTLARNERRTDQRFRISRL
jgi:hypothetical protein